MIEARVLKKQKFKKNHKKPPQTYVSKNNYMVWKTNNLITNSL